MTTDTAVRPDADLKPLAPNYIFLVDAAKALANGDISVDDALDRLNFAYSEKGPLAGVAERFKGQGVRGQLAMPRATFRSALGDNMASFPEAPAGIRGGTGTGQVSLMRAHIIALEALCVAHGIAYPPEQKPVKAVKPETPAV